MLSITSHDLFYKWKFVPFESLYSFYLNPLPPGNHQSVFCIFELLFFCFSEPKYKWDHKAFVCLPDFPIVNTL